MNPALRHIPATPGDLTGWQGPVIVREGDAYFPGVLVSTTASGTSARVYHHGRWEGPPLQGYSVEHNVFLRTDIDAVRDHLIRRYALPDWHRDTSGGLSPEQSAAVVLGSVMRVRAGMEPIAKLLPDWKRSAGRSEDWSRTGANDGRYLHVTAGCHMSGTMHDADRRLILWWRWNLSRFDRHFVTVAEGRRDTVAEAKHDADAGALAHGLALLTPTGILLPPLAPGGEPVLWIIG